MCKVSDKLKLCTCENKSKELNDYWVLYRYVKDKNTMLVGEVVMPAFLDPATDKFNRSLLLKLLNDEAVFDEPLYPVAKDRLQLSFKDAEGYSFNYGFVYKKGAWEEIEYDFFDWNTKHDEIKNGEIKDWVEKR